MNTENYKNCLFATGSSSGFLRGSYNFSNRVGSVILNDLYPTGEVYFKSGDENVFYVNKLNLSLFSGDQIYSNQFTGASKPPLNLRLENFESPNDFNILIDFSIDSCSSTEPVVLFSSSTGTNLNSGFIFGYNAINKWFLEYGTGANKVIRTFRNSLLNQKNLISFGVLGDVFHFKKYDTVNNIMINEQEELKNFKYSDKFIFGKSFQGYSGFSGNINHIFLSANNPKIEDVNYFECAFCTGLSTGIKQENLSGDFYNPLSFDMVEISGTGITGYKGEVIFNSNLGIYQSVQAPLTGHFISEVVVTGSTQSQQSIFEQEFSDPLIEEKRKKDYNNDLISIVFISNVESGDLLEIYDYNEINNNIDLSANQIFSSDLAVFSNGMLFVSGLDYSVSSNGLIEYDSDDSDEIRVNKISSPIQYLLYSGLHQNYRQITGLHEHTGYYPASSQFLETGDGNVTITGFDSLFFNGFKLSGYDLFMNGQKIYSGIDYTTGITGGKESLIIHASNFNDAKLAITVDGNGELISIDESTESILAFSPVQNQNYRKILDYRTSSVMVYPVSGSSVEIWLNGIKMIKNIDYSIKLPCEFSSKTFNLRNLTYVF